MALILKTDFTQVELNPKNGTDFSLEELQHAVGGNIEIACVNTNQLVIVDEDGLLKDKPVNELACLVLGIILYGDVLICESSQVK